MFESDTAFGDDDFALDTSFTPIFSSTQANSEKRRNETLVDGSIPKKIKVDLPASPFIENRRLENRENSFYSPNKVVQRMFPGPAGLLGNLANAQQNPQLVNRSREDNEDFLLCSQNTVSAFEEGPWIRMKKDFHSSESLQLYEKYNISWIKKNYSHKKLLNNYKVPFLAAVIQNIDTVEGKIPSVHITLKDTTGLIDATILYNFYKDNSQYLTSGSVIVMKQFGVLCSPEGHCLTLTSNNILVIYHIKDVDSKEPEDSSSRISKIILQKCTSGEIWKEASSMKNIVPQLKNSSVNNKPQFSNIYTDKHNFKPNINNAKSVCSISGISKSNNTNSTSNLRSNSIGDNFLLPKHTKIAPNSNPTTSNLNIFENFNIDNIHPKTNKKFEFKKTNNALTDVINCASNSTVSSNSVQNTVDTSEICKTMLDGIDTDSLFEDF